MVKVFVKWQKDTYEIELASSDVLQTLYGQLFALTNVPVERQKILVKGKVVKSDADLTGLEEGAKLMMMGSANALPEEPSKKIVFEEDLSNEEKSKLGEGNVGAGLGNLGNTCYMNSTLQCLRSIPDLKQSLRGYMRRPAQQSDLSHLVTFHMGQLFTQLDGSDKPLVPVIFTETFRKTFPNFAEKNEEGHYMQQDADECLSQLLTVLSANLVQAQVDTSKKSSPVDDLFGVQMTSTLQCKENDKEPPTTEVTVTRKLRCHIESDINFLHDGIMKSLTEEVEKRSETLGRNAVYVKTSFISHLPKYLVVQFVRFFWRRDTNKKAKILRRVQFPLKLDVQPYCSPELKAAIIERRNKKTDEEAMKLGLKPLSKVAKTDAAKAAPATQAAPAAAPAAQAAPATPAASTTPATSTAVTPATTENKQAPVLNHSGFYELFAVITHQGRIADSGHYVGWVKKKPNEWWKFDDDVVSLCTDDDILKLSGGGDWHMAYVTFYRVIED